MRLALVLVVSDTTPVRESLLAALPAPGSAAPHDLCAALAIGSAEASREVLERHAIPIVASRLAGRGEAYLEAFERVDADAWIFFTPDGSDAVADLPRFRPILLRGSELVIASRLSEGALLHRSGATGAARSLVHNGLSLAANRLFGRDMPFISDAGSGFRALTRGAAERLALDATDGSIDFQMTARALEERLSVAEFPTVEGAPAGSEASLVRRAATHLPTGAGVLRRLAGEYRRARARR